MKPKVYVETTILSYLAARPSRQPVTAGRQVITRQWWETERKKYNLVRVGGGRGGMRTW